MLCCHTYNPSIHPLHTPTSMIQTLTSSDSTNQVVRGDLYVFLLRGLKTPVQQLELLSHVPHVLKRSPTGRLFFTPELPFQQFFVFFFALFPARFGSYSPLHCQLTSCHHDLTQFPQESKQFHLYLRRLTFRCWNVFRPSHNCMQKNNALHKQH